MKQHKHLAFLFALVFAAMALADDPPASPPATKEDIQDVQRSLVRIHRDEEKVAKEAAKESDAARSAERQEYKDITGAISHSENAVTDAVKEQGNAVDTGLNSLNRTLRLGFISGGLLLAVGILLGLWVFKGRSTREIERRAAATAQAYLSANPPIHEPVAMIQVIIPDDAKPEEIVQWCVKYAEATKLDSFDLPYAVNLEKEGVRVLGSVHFEVGSEGLMAYGVDFPGEPRRGLKDRYQAAAKSFLLQSRTATNGEGKELIQ